MNTEKQINAEELAQEIHAVAFAAADKVFQEELNGIDQYACGFAWVTIHPEHKGNTRAGKAERKLLEAMGFSKDWTGKAYQLWNPSKWGGQNIDVKEAGAQAAAALLKSKGFAAYAGSRMD